MQAAARFREAIAILEHARDRAASSGCDLDLAERAATAVRDTVRVPRRGGGRAHGPTHGRLKSVIDGVPVGRELG